MKKHFLKKEAKAKKKKGKTITEKKKATEEKTKKKTALATVKKIRVLEFLLTFQTRIIRQTLDSRHESLITK